MTAPRHMARGAGNVRTLLKRKSWSVHDPMNPRWDWARKPTNRRLIALLYGLIPTAGAYGMYHINEWWARPLVMLVILVLWRAHSDVLNQATRGIIQIPDADLDEFQASLRLRANALAFRMFRVIAAFLFLIAVLGGSPIDRATLLAITFATLMLIVQLPWLVAAWILPDKSVD